MDGIRKSTLDALRPAVKMAEWSPQGARTTCANRNFVDRVVPIAQAVPFRLFGLRSARFISGSSLDCEATGPVDLDEAPPIAASCTSSAGPISPPTSLPNRGVRSMERGVWRPVRQRQERELKLS